MNFQSSHPAASPERIPAPCRGITGAQVEARAPAHQRAEIGAGSVPALDCPTEEAGAPNLLTLPAHLITTIRNNQLPTAELADLTGLSCEVIDAVRSLGAYCGGDVLEPSNGSTWMLAEEAALTMEAV